MKMKPLVTTLTGTTTKCLVTIVASMELAVFSSSPAAAQSLVCGTAMLREVEVVTSRVPQSTITSVQKKPENGKSACVSKGTLRLRRPDGKDYKTKIVHVVRDVAHEPTQGGFDR